MSAPSMQPLPEHSAFWVEKRREIAASPDNDELRLQYALEWDRLNLDPRRSWVIRAQVRLAQLAGGVDHPDWLRLSLQVRRVLSEGVREWTPQWFEPEGLAEAEFHRGFLELVTAPASVLLNPHQRQRLFEDDPIRHLNIVGIEDDKEFAMIVASPEMLRVISLRVDGQRLTDQSMLTLAQNSNVRNLRWLSAAYNQIGEAGVRAVAEASQGWGLLRNLQYAEFHGNALDPAERFDEDQGIVTGRSAPQMAQELEAAFGTLPWLHREVVGGRVITPDRLEIGRQSSPSIAVSA